MKTSIKNLKVKVCNEVEVEIEEISSEANAEELISLIKEYGKLVKKMFKDEYGKKEEIHS